MTALAAAAQTLQPLEAAAHSRLAGAIWLTDEENKLILEMAGASDAPILPLRFTFPFSIVGELQPNEVSPVAVRSREVLNRAADWLVTETLTPPASLPQRMMGLLRQGSFIFLIVSTGVSGLNLIHNVLMGRLLSPADYSQLTLLITLQLLIGLLPATLQTVVARFGARYHARHDETTLRELLRQARRFSGIAGVAITVGMLVLSPLIIGAFQLRGIGLLVPLLLALPTFILMGADRGILQGVGHYLWLSAAYLTEGVIRLGVGILLGYALIRAGRSLEGAVWGVSQAMLATWFIGWLAVRHIPPAPTDSPPATIERPAWIQLASLTLLALIGQALITNSDFLMVKNFFTSDEAGLYAAISVLGRIVYFGALPLTVLLVPLIARRQALGEPTRPILTLLLVGGAVICSGLVLGAWLFGAQVLQVLYGNAYLSAVGLLAPYALAASLYTLTNLTITYQIALGQGGETGLPIIAGIAQIALIGLFHQTLLQVIGVQIGLMAVLFVVVLWRVLTAHPKTILGLPAQASA